MLPFLSLFYPISYLSAFVGLVLLPYSNKEERLIPRIALSFFMLMSLDALFAGLLTIAHIPTNLLSSTIFHIIITLGTGYLIYSNKAVQQLRFDSIDTCALVSLGAFAILCGRAEFGPDLTIHWLASDAAVHLDRIRTIVETDTVRGMYVAWNFIAPWVEIASEFLSSTSIYKVLIVGDVTILFFGGMILYSLTLSLIPDADRNQRVTAVVASLLYMLGYPLNSMIFGFFYLNVGVFMAVCSVIFCSKLIMTMNTFNVIGMALSLFGLINSYALFAPTMYLTLFIALVLNWRKQKLPFNKKLIFVFILTFVCTGLLGIYFTYYGTFPTSDTTTATSAISWNGGIYRNLYSNQVLLAPFALVALWALRKKPFFSPEALSLLSIAATLLAVFLLTFSHTVSTYYFFKFYFLLSPFMFACATYGILHTLAHGAQPILASIGITVGIIGIFAISGVDQRLASYAPAQDYGIPSNFHPSLDIYTYNYSTLRSETEFNPGTMELYEQAEQLTDETDRPIALLGNAEQYHWWIALVRQGEKRQNYPAELRSWQTETPTEAYSNIKETCDYVVVLTQEPFESVGSLESKEIAIMLSANPHEVVFANNAGYILRIFPD